MSSSSRSDTAKTQFWRLGAYLGGGVTIVYRKAIQASPAYRNNHYELKQALAEGILYAEHADPIHVQCDNDGHVMGLRVRYTHDAEPVERVLPAKNILVATGAKPNVAYAFEHAGSMARNGFQYALHTDKNGVLQSADASLHCKEDHLGFFSSYDIDKRRVSIVGDTHPAFHGSVKAIASAKNSYRHARLPARYTQ